MGTVPLLLLAIVSYNHAAHIANLAGLQSLLPGLLQTEIFTVGIGILLAVILALTLGASLVEPVETIGRGLAAVREGNLEVEIAVTANDELGMLASGFNAMVAGLRREEVIRRMFGLYVTPEVADYAIQHGVELGGGQLTEATVMFVDIRGFTSIAEKLVPEAVIALLNRYFQAISGVVIQHGGLVNKFGGDSLLAIFGSPLNPATDHAQQAVLSAEAIVQSLEHFNQDQRRRDEPTLQVGIGLASGPVLAGNVGSTERLEYTVIGDTVNLASRLDALTKELDVPVLLTEATARAVVEGTALQQVGEVQLRGRQEPVQVYALQGGNHQHESSGPESSVRIPRTYG
jgi:adenylate cyclase